jgi:predicted outer membrane repeat protein
VTVTNGTLTSNTAQDGYESNADGGAVCIFDNVVLTLNGTLFDNNTAPSGRGGGVAVTSKR